VEWHVVSGVLNFLERLSFLAAMPGVLGVTVTASALAVSRRWRVNVILLTVQYFLVVLLLTRLVRLEMAAIRGIVGWIVCLVFYLTEQRVHWQGRLSGSEGRASGTGWLKWVLSAEESFRLFAAMMISIAAYTASFRYPLIVLDVPTDILLACYVLAGLGLLTAGLGESATQVGTGLLTLLSGFDLLYVAIEPSLAVTGLLSAISLVIALAMAFLRTADATAELEVM
jgi:hypothetical protein